MLNFILNFISQEVFRIANQKFGKTFSSKLWKFNLCPVAIAFLAIVNTLPAIANARIEGLNKTKSAVVESEADALNSSAISPFADGTYIFGRSPQTEQYGVTYAVFEVRQGTTAGAFYEVASEYSCFIGTVENQQLSLSVQDIDGTIYPYEIALEDRSTLATRDGLMRTVGLQGFHRLEELSESDRRILKSCAEH
ncbi:MAG: hypothetical protein J7647_12725 [Cyanobacteria bacterium SBLK]|nr:hypothetical protein [Cyanobacteria bacterium SBLK]